MGMTRDDWIESAVQMLVRQGVDGVRVEVLARKLGVTKGSFYWHFEDRDALLEAMIGAWEEETRQLLADANEGPPGLGRLRSLLETISRSFGRLPDAAIYSWALRDPAVSKRGAAVDRHRIDFMLQAAVDAGISRVKAERISSFGYLSYCGWVMREGVSPDNTPDFKVFAKWLMELFEDALPE